MIPPNCTDWLQPLDMSVNKPAKEFLCQKFHTWSSQIVCALLEEKAPREPVHGPSHECGKTKGYTVDDRAVCKDKTKYYKKWV